MRFRDGFGWRGGRRAVLAMSAAFALVGCQRGEVGSPRAAVSGAVFTSGKPLKSGLVRFVPIGATDGPMAVATVSDGFYALSEVDGPVVGTHRVEVVAADFLGFDPGDQEAAERALKANKGKLPRSPVPPGYGAKSPLRAEVPAEGLPSCDFVLDSRGGAVASL